MTPCRWRSRSLLDEVHAAGKVRDAAVSNLPGRWRPFITNQIEYEPSLGQDIVLAAAREAGVDYRVLRDGRRQSPARARADGHRRAQPQIGGAGAT